jgi:hypothetical protein
MRSVLPAKSQREPTETFLTILIVAKGYPLLHRRDRVQRAQGRIDDRSLGLISHSLQRSDDVVQRTIDQVIWCTPIAHREPVRDVG